MKIIFHILFLLPCFLFGQNSDSLKLALKNARHDTTRCAIYLKLSEEIYMEKPDSAINYCNLAITFSEKSNYKKGLANGLMILASIDFQKNKYIESLEKYEKAQKLYKELNNFSKVAKILMMKGLIYLEITEYEKSLTSFFKSGKIYEDLKDTINIANIYSNIGVVHTREENWSSSEKWLWKALNLREKTNDNLGLAVSYNAAGQMKWGGGDNKTSLVYFRKSMELYKNLNDLVGVATNYFIMRLPFESMNMPDSVIFVLEKGLETALKSKNKRCLIESETVLAQFLLKINRNEDALKYYEDALLNSEKISNTDFMESIYFGLSGIYENKHDFKKSHLYLKKYMKINSENNSINKNRQLLETQAKYDINQKDNEILVLNKENEKKNIARKEESKRQNLILLLVIIGFLLAVIFTGFIFRALRITKKQKLLIEIKNKETETQKIIIQEKHKEITDSINYAERIQRSFLATKEILDENLNDYFVFFQPKDVVSGDFYWASKLSNSNFALVTADSTGHGVPGAIMSLLNITSLETAIKDGYTKPTDILNDTRKTIIERLKKDGSEHGGKDGMDASLICFDFANNKFTYAAANNPVWVVRKNQLIELNPNKMPIGKHDKDFEPFIQHEFEMQKGDVVYTLTDGMPDQFGGPKGKKFMYKQLKELLVFISHEAMEKQKQILAEELNNWKGDLEQVDDICLIGIKV